jgi:hypothetical protein
MSQKISIYKRISLVLGITTLLLGLIPVPVLGRIGMVSADDSVVADPLSSESESPAETPPAEEPPAEEPLLEEPLLEEPPLEEPLVEGPPLDEPLVEEPPLEEPPLDEGFSLRLGAISLFSVSSAIGDDPLIADELPDFGTNYSNGDCVTNDSCVTDEPVTNPNDYTDQGTYGEKDYSLPDIGGNTANIVAVKRGNDWFFFKVGSGESCDETTFCVEFDGSGNVKVYSYEPQAHGYLGYNMIHFWYVAPPDEGIPGCTDRTATNFNPDATEDDDSCEYEEVNPGCMDQTATNYDPKATEDDGSCEYEEENPLNLTLNAVCTPGDGGYFLAWYINNPNDFDVNASWDLNGSNGAGSMSPGSNFVGTTPLGNASYTLNASWSFGEASKSAQALCQPEITENPPDDTATVTFVAPQAPLIIPVTGVDLDSGFPLYRRLMLLAGSALLTSGLFMKGTTKKEKKLK